MISPTGSQGVQGPADGPAPVSRTAATMVSRGRQITITQQLRRAGFSDAKRAATLLGDQDLAAVWRDDHDRLIDTLSKAADPDTALLELVRLAEQSVEHDLKNNLIASLVDDETRLHLITLLGASRALADVLITHPQDVDLLTPHSDDGPILDLEPEDERALALRAVGADPQEVTPVAAAELDEGTDIVRRTYRRRILSVAAADLNSDDPLGNFPRVAAAISDIVAGTLDAALAVARASRPDGARSVRLAILGMGKLGGRELNYISDVDVVYAAAPAGPESDSHTGDDAVIAEATHLATTLANVCSAPSAEPPLWPVDTNLRPEGADGPLVRTVESHLAYYTRWAKSWEFQALLKARPVAGDAELGHHYCQTLAPLIWTAVEKDRFVEDAQAMRRRVEAHVPRRDADRQLKLGAGGLRDVEFTVQLLQLVHGRTDEALRVRTTLDGLTALVDGGYVGREAAGAFDYNYRFLRTLEHRMQLWRLRRTQVVPDDAGALRRLARSMGLEGLKDAESLEAAWRKVRLDVRSRHEAIFYRPLLPATAKLSVDEASLTHDAALDRLTATGFKDPEGTIRHIDALTEGVSRRARIQRHLLPAMLGWFAQTPLPDQGLLAFRKISDHLGSIHWYLGFLRDSAVAAAALAKVLGSSRYAANALLTLPNAVRWLEDSERRVPRPTDALDTELDNILKRRDRADEAVAMARYLRYRELTRAALADVLDSTPGTSRVAISHANELALRAALRVASWAATHDAGLDEPPSDYIIVAMGRLGGRETGYGSDADVMFVHDPHDNVDPQLASEVAVDVAKRVRALLSETGEHQPLPVDGDLRPEGRNGPLTRTLASYREYYERWVEPWERQALLRARPVAGSLDLGERFVELIHPIRYPVGGLDLDTERVIVRTKERVETERMTRGVPPQRHLKLGPGGLSDVEWTVQIMQLRHAAEFEQLQVPGTIEALHGLVDANLLTESDGAHLEAAWRLASRIRNAIVLASGRASGPKVDVLPSDIDELETTSRLLGYSAGERVELEEDYLRVARRARRVVDKLFYS